MSQALVCNVCGKVIQHSIYESTGLCFAQLSVRNLYDGYNSESQDYNMDLCGKCLEMYFEKEVIIRKGDIV